MQHEYDGIWLNRQQIIGYPVLLTTLTVRVGHIPPLIHTVDFIAVASSNERNAASIAERGERVTIEPVTIKWFSRAAQPACEQATSRKQLAA
jgi:hypothetical protein